MNVILNVPENLLETCRDLEGYCRQSLDQILVLVLNEQKLVPGTEAAIEQLEGRARLVPVNVAGFVGQKFVTDHKLRDAYVILGRSPSEDWRYPTLVHEIFEALETGYILRQGRHGTFRPVQHK